MKGKGGAFLIQLKKKKIIQVSTCPEWIISFCYSFDLKDRKNMPISKL